MRQHPASILAPQKGCGTRTEGSLPRRLGRGTVPVRRIWTKKVADMKSPFPWMGGKRRLADNILASMPEHTCYVEPFAGSGAVLFAREEPAKVEVLNDIDSELVNFFRVAKHHLVEFCNQFRFAVSSRQIFDWLKATPADTLTDIQRAARFYYLQRLTFGAKVTSRAFGTSTTSRPKLNLVRLEEDMSEVHARLSSVFIEHLDWAECIRRYDRPHTFFFIDPPYWKLAGYGRAFALGDYERLADTMASIAGKALLTINDHPEMRRVFGRFSHESVQISYSIGGGRRATRATELLYRSW